MPKYLIKASYAPEGVKGLMKEGGTGRRDIIGKLIGSMGGTMESFYFAFGEDDAYVICELPDNVTVTSLSLAVNSVGAVHIKTVVLLTPEEVDEATGKTVDYRPPGG
jgi:uncharacterized protein with GYD domain